MYLQENTLFDIDLGVKVTTPRSHETLSSTLNIMHAMHLQRFKLLHPYVYEVYIGGDAFTKYII